MRKASELLDKGDMLEVHFIFAMAGNLDTGEERSFLDFIEIRLADFDMRSILVTIVDLHQTNLFSKESVNDCYENRRRIECWFTRDAIKEKRAVWDNVPMHDDLENLYEAINQKSFVMKKAWPMGYSGRVDFIPSFTFRKLTSESLKMIDTKDPTFLNTCLRYGESNLPDASSCKKDNSKHLVEDELRIKLESESNARYILMICFRFTMILGNPKMPEFDHWSHVLVPVPVDSEPDWSQILPQIELLLKKFNRKPVYKCYKNFK